MLANMSVDQALLKAKSLVVKGEIAQAQTIYKTILKNTSNNIKAKKALSELQRHNIPQNLSKETIDQLMDLFNKGQFSAVIQKAQVLSKQYPKEFFIWNILGASRAQIGMFEDAIKSYKNAISLNPNSAQLWSNLAISLNDLGKFNDALEAHKKSITLNPNDADSYYNFGICLNDQGKFDEAIGVYKKAISLKPNYADAYFNMGDIFKKQGKIEETIEAYEKSISLKPDYVEAYFNIGNIFKDQGKLKHAFTAYNKALSIRPDFAEVYNNLGIVLKRQGKFNEAINAYKKCISYKPNYAEAYSNMGNALKDLGKLDKSIKAYKKSISLKPEYAEAHNNLGLAFVKENKFEKAIKAYKKSIFLKPEYAEAYSNMGNVFKDQGKLDEAIKAHKKSILLKPEYVEAYINMGNALLDKNLFDQAISVYNKALSLKPNYAKAYNNIAVALKEQNKFSEAINSLQKAILLKPDYAEANFNLANIYKDQGKIQKGIDTYKKALLINPNYEIARAEKLHQLAYICDWKNIEEDSKFIPLLGNNKQFISPFSILALEDAPNRHRIRSEKYVKARHPKNILPFKKISIKTKKRIRIGYFSADFREHPVAYLIAKVLEQHNRSEFEVFGYSLYDDKHCDFRQRLVKAFDYFTKIQGMSNIDKVIRVRQDNLDIAVDLTGYTEHNCSEIFGYRVAPIQINYLGYPGTTGSINFDYIIADKFLIPPENQKYFSEKPIYLPNTYMPTDNTREISKNYLSKKECNLPEDSFVFCCFNNNYKITSVEFDIWMRLLSKIEKSVLWLRKFNDISEINLKKEALKRNIDSSRIIFAERVPMRDHLARYQLADLFLDTFNFNAHATASEALWAGLPVITKVGKGFASRVAGSLLNAIDLPELITNNEREYEALILELATNPRKLLKIKEKLSTNRLSKPLFNTEMYTIDLENGYKKAYNNYLKLVN